MYEIRTAWLLLRFSVRATSILNPATTATILFSNCLFSKFGQLVVTYQIITAPTSKDIQVERDYSQLVGKIPFKALN